MPQKINEEEKNFQGWYGGWADKLGLNPNPDDPRHYYDYRAAFRAGATPASDGHWPSAFKLPEHPNRYVGGIDTITGQKYQPKIDEGSMTSITGIPVIPTISKKDAMYPAWAAAEADRSGITPDNPYYKAWLRAVGGHELSEPLVKPIPPKEEKREEEGIGEREPGKIYYKKTKQGMAYQDFKAPGFKEWTPKYKERKTGGLSFYGPGFEGITTEYKGKTYTPEETWRNVLKTSDKTFKVGGVDVPESAYGLGETGALAGYLPPQAPRAPLTTQEDKRVRINEITMEVMRWSRRNPANQPFAQQELEYRLRQENLMAPPAQTAFSPLTTQQRQAYEQLLRMPLWEGVTVSDIKNIMTGMGTEGEFMAAIPPSPELKGGGTITYTGKTYGGGGGMPIGGGQSIQPPAGYTQQVIAPDDSIGYKNPQTGEIIRLKQGS